MVKRLVEICVLTCSKNIVNELYLNLKTKFNNNSVVVNLINNFKSLPIVLQEAILYQIEPFYLEIIEEYDLKVKTNGLWKIYLHQLINYLKKYMISIEYNQVLIDRRYETDDIDFKKHYFEIVTNLWLLLSLRNGRYRHEIVFRLTLMTKSLFQPIKKYEISTRGSSFESLSSLFPNYQLEDPCMFDNEIHPCSQIYEIIYYRMLNRWSKSYIDTLSISFADILKYFLNNLKITFNDTCQVIHQKDYFESKYNEFLHDYILNMLDNTVNELILSNFIDDLTITSLNNLFISTSTLPLVSLTSIPIMSDASKSYFINLYQSWLKFLVKILEKNQTRIKILKFNNFNETEYIYMIKQLKFEKFQNLESFEIESQHFGEKFIDPFIGPSQTSIIRKKYCEMLTCSLPPIESKLESSLDATLLLLSKNFKKLSIDGVNVCLNSLNYLFKIRWLKLCNLSLYSKSYKLNKGVLKQLFDYYHYNNQCLQLIHLQLKNVTCAFDEPELESFITIYDPKMEFTFPASNLNPIRLGRIEISNYKSPSIELVYLINILSKFCTNLEILALNDIEWRLETIEFHDIDTFNCNYRLFNSNDINLKKYFAFLLLFKSISSLENLRYLSMKNFRLSISNFDESYSNTDMLSNQRLNYHTSMVSKYISELQSLKIFKELEYLDLTKCNLFELDSQNDDLLLNTHITITSEYLKIFLDLASLKKLKCLVLSSVNITDQNIDTLINTIEARTTQLHAIDLSHNKITFNYLWRLLERLEVLSDLKITMLHNNQINYEEIRILKNVFDAGFELLTL